MESETRNFVPVRGGLLQVFSHDGVLMAIHLKAHLQKHSEGMSLKNFKELLK
jgi:hypothetical protein